jgi:hypothetical protein
VPAAVVLAVAAVLVGAAEVVVAVVLAVVAVLVGAAEVVVAVVLAVAAVLVGAVVAAVVSEWGRTLVFSPCADDLTVLARTFSIANRRTSTTPIYSEQPAIELRC